VASERAAFVTLRALIIRADGVLADIDELRRTALNRMISDAGFSWQCDRATYATSLKFGSTGQRMISFIMPRLGYQRSSPDVEHLAAAMVRRKATILSELLRSSPLAARPGIRDLIVAAKTEGLRLALATSLQSSDAVRIAEAALGSEGTQRLDVIAAPKSGLGTEPLETVYALALDQLEVPACECLVLESKQQGLAAASAAGLRVVVIRSAYADDDGLEQAVFVADDVPALIGLTGNSRLDPFTSQHRADVVAALQRLHAGHSGPEGGSERSSVMKVSTILQTKGSNVKTITASASVRELSQRLKSDAVGAMVVVSDGGQLAGIISERDVARGLAEHGAALPSLPVSELMTKGVVTCAPEDSIANISKIMTQRRIRHLPVLQGGDLVGLVSIGDVLKYRLDEVQLEANVLRDYAIAKS
jgi:CBS domain-containing protein/beta-phosphoglucomutase-like phosphatase (HAD superfamily)